MELPQASGNSCLASVVLISWKNEPLCVARKWLINRILLMFSATIVNPVFCINPKPVGDLMFPVDRKFSIWFSRDPDCFRTVSISAANQKEGDKLLSRRAEVCWKIC